MLVRQSFHTCRYFITFGDISKLLSWALSTEACLRSSAAGMKINTFSSGSLALLHGKIVLRGQASGIFISLFLRSKNANVKAAVDAQPKRHKQEQIHYCSPIHLIPPSAALFSIPLAAGSQFHLVYSIYKGLTFENCRNSVLNLCSSSNSAGYEQEKCVLCLAYLGCWRSHTHRFWASQWFN